MRTVTHTIVATLALTLAYPEPLFAQSAKGNRTTKASSAKSDSAKERASKKSAAKPSTPSAGSAKASYSVTNSKEPASVDEVLQRLKKKYRQGEISRTTLWGALVRLTPHEDKLTPERRAEFLQMQADILADSAYPITATITAKRAISVAKNPYGKDQQRSWSIIEAAARQRSVHAIVEDLAKDIYQVKKEPPALENNWHYFAGNALAREGKLNQALEEYKGIRIGDRYFMPAKYQQAMVHIQLEQLTEAESVLKSLVDPTTARVADLQIQDIKDIQNYSRLALGRLLYEQKRFKESIGYFRSVARDSIIFYDALFEQSWALFMAGFPNHALGSLHAVDSPFFKDVFNPETTILRSIVYYWMCRYEDSRNALADFSEYHAENVEALASFLDRRRLTPETTYTLFEDLISGVSQSSLGLPVAVLNNAAEKDGMLLLRAQYADAVRELDRLEARGVLKVTSGVDTVSKHLQAYIASLRTQIGSQFLAELKHMKSDFDQLYDQAQFLYLELLMSEKEQLLGRELHANSKMSKVSMRRNVGGWGGSAVSWTGDDKEEFWWDEIGYYIYRETPQCSQ